MLTREQIAEKITKMGAGAATKWNTIAVSAMAGNEQAKSACVELEEVADTDERTPNGLQNQTRNMCRRITFC